MTVRPSTTVSTRLLRKGALLEATRAAFVLWQTALSFDKNLASIRTSEQLGAQSAAWQRELVVTLSNRFKRFPPKRLAELHVLARHAGEDVWQAVLNWHCATADAIYRAFATGWLFEYHGQGGYALRSRDLAAEASRLMAVATPGRPALTEYGNVRLARDLVRAAKEFGLVDQRAEPVFKAYHLPDQAILYLLHAMQEDEPSAHRLVHSDVWRLYLMTPDDVERELFRLHQLGKLHYQVAGSVAELRLPFASALDFVHAEWSDHD